MQWSSCVSITVRCNSTLCKVLDTILVTRLKKRIFSTWRLADLCKSITSSNSEIKVHETKKRLANMIGDVWRCYLGGGGQKIFIFVYVQNVALRLKDILIIDCRRVQLLCILLQVGNKCNYSITIQFFLDSYLKCIVLFQEPGIARHRCVKESRGIFAGSPTFVQPA